MFYTRYFLASTMKSNFIFSSKMETEYSHGLEYYIQYFTANSFTCHTVT